MEYKDRSTGLIVFGILTAGLGVICALLIVLLVGVTLVAPPMAQASPSVAVAPRPAIATLVPAIAVYGILGVALTWLGIGSIMAARWARALLLIFSWSWLVVGVTVIVMMAFLLPPMLGNFSTSPQPAGAPPPAAVMDGILTTIFVFYGIVFVALPGLWTFFYSSRHVRATCEARHPRPSWTDACPLPVLAIVLWLVYSVLMTTVMPVTGMNTMPFFGMFLTGLPADAVFFVLAVVYGLGAWRLYRLDMAGWWLVTAAMCFFLVSGVVTFSQHDLMDMYRTMNLPADQLAQMEKMGILREKGLLWLAMTCFLPIFGYLVYIRRYLRPSATGGAIVGQA